MVREAVLRMKDVGQMLDEIEEIEKLQMTSLGSDPMPNEKGLEEKKAKLHSSVHRVAAYYVSHVCLLCTLVHVLSSKLHSNHVFVGPSRPVVESISIAQLLANPCLRSTLV